jgi:hypothetical protein
VSRKRLPARRPILRVVEGGLDQTAENARPISCFVNAETLIKTVVERLHADAAQIADDLMSWASAPCQGLGAELTSEQSTRLRKSAFDIVVELFRTRLVLGLANSCDRMNGVGGWDENFLPDTDSPQGLMARFRAALAEDDEQS